MVSRNIFSTSLYINDFCLKPFLTFCNVHIVQRAAYKDMVFH